MNEELLNRIKRLIEDYFKTGRADKLKTDGLAEIKLVIKRSGGFWKDYKNQLNILIKEVEKELFEKFSNERSSKIDNIIKSELNKIIRNETTFFSNNVERIQKIIASAIDKSAQNKDWESIVRRELTKIGLEERHIKTEVETTKAALDNLKRYQDILKVGDENIKLRYEGPEPERRFCKEHYGKVYSLEEIKGLVNDFGQPALAYCGGYNCRHRWSPIFDLKNDLTSIRKSYILDPENKNNKESKMEITVKTPTGKSVFVKYDIVEELFDISVPEVNLRYKVSDLVITDSTPFGDTKYPAILGPKNIALDNNDKNRLREFRTSALDYMPDIEGLKELADAYSQRAKAIEEERKIMYSAVNKSYNLSTSTYNIFEIEDKIKILEEKHKAAKYYIRWSKMDASSKVGFAAKMAAKALRSGKSLQEAMQIYNNNLNL